MKTGKNSGIKSLIYIDTAVPKIICNDYLTLAKIGLLRAMCLGWVTNVATLLFQIAFHIAHWMIQPWSGGRRICCNLLVDL